jgi:hypothetical protein
MGFKAPVAGILVQAHEFAVPGFFDEPIGRPEQHIGAKQAADWLDDARIGHHLPGPALQQVQIGTGGTLFLLGGILMAINVWRTIRGDASVDLAEQPSSAAAPELRPGAAAVPAE